jgi:methyl-accepting chemotaxis protein
MKHWIGNLKMWQKFALIGALAVGMVAGPTALMVKGHWELMDAARAEAAGMGPAGDVLKLIQLTQHHRGLTAGVLAGNDKAKAAREAKQAEVEQALQKVQVSAGSFGANKLTARSATIQNEWRALAQGLAGNSVSGPDSYKRHTALIAEQLSLLEGITDASTLALDPEAGTYYLITAVMGELPKLSESLGQMRARGATLLGKGTALPEERAAIASLADATKSFARSSRSAFDKSIDADPAVKAAIEKPLADAVSAVESGLKLADEQIVRAETPSMSSADYFAGMTRVIDSQFELTTQAFKALEDMLAARVAAKQRELGIVALVIVVFGSLALWVLVLVTRTTTRSVAQALAAAEALAAGDLTQRVQAQTGDEIGQLVRALGSSMSNLARVVGAIKDSTDSVKTAATEIAQGNLDLSQRTEEQSANLQQTAASMEQLTATVKQNADTARQASELANSASAVATEGGSVVERVISNMEDITDSSKRIADIIGVIDGIAFQTNILALNAAVEAARAGENGRGFAVVAAEVRSLAQRSAQAAKEIKALIGQSVEKVEAGAKLVGDAGKTMNDVVLQVRHVSTLIGEISSASVQQTTGIGQIGDAVAQLDQVTQQNAALVEESAAAAESLSQQATHLAQAVAVFRLAA